MCSRYNLTSPPEAVRAYFSLHSDAQFPPRYNIAPTQPTLIVRRSATGARELVLVRWGLIAPWVKDPRERATLINARAETAAEKPSFRGAMRHKRCLVPANGFYEWKGVAQGKRPYLLQRRDRGLLALAGLYEHWLGADGSELETMAILTVASNATIRPIHDRMPAIVAPEFFDTWLDCRGGSSEPVKSLLEPAPADLLEAVEIDPRIANPEYDSPELLQPVRTTLL